MDGERENIHSTTVATVVKLKFIRVSLRAENQNTFERS